MNYKVLSLVAFLSLSASAIEQRFHLTIPMQQMSVTDTYIFSQPKDTAEILENIKFEDILNVQNFIIDNSEAWWELQLKTGDIGYIRVQDLSDIYDNEYLSKDPNFNPLNLGLTNVAKLLFLNPEIKVDPQLAIPYLEQALMNNDATAYWLRGIAYRDGLGIHKDTEAAITDFLRATNGGENRAFYDLALMFANKDDTLLFNLDEALRLCRTGAESGDPRAKEWLASLDMATISEKTDPAKQLLEAMLAKANEHNTDAMRLVAALYLTGRGTQINGIEAEKWLTKAALLGDNQAMLDLGAMYFSGNKDITPNSEQSTYWYRIAAENGSAKGQYLFGNALYYGLGTEKDEKQAIYWLKIAAQNGYQQALFDLSEIESQKKIQKSQ
ncbi:MAG: tetratricopeptide repeat protein [Alphaproteobacteria bacterium]